ncbi:sigma-54-dependent Fis family transcriptional regulator [Flavonifractor sp. HCP28S3_F3]|uniref:sigma-54-dependent Fis family transcriptional regulator n=1 Tax=Flavonifractor sp. HCP28S3_F3 TaxID=3438939 RepID=UPI003F889303
MDIRNQVSEAKELLRNGDAVPDDMVRDVIRESWLRCRARGVPMQDADKRVLPPGELQKRRDARKSLCEVAFPFLDGLYDFIRGSEFLVLISDEEGYILYERGDPQILSTAQKTGLIEGACRSEDRLGTNGVGTVLVTQQPLQVFAEEHYYEVHVNWSCSGAPIFLPDGRLGGSVCLSGMAEKVNYHTLGMVVAAADAISRQLKLKSAYDELALVWQNMNIIIETVPAAICLLDEQLQVTTFNAQATKLLDVLPQDLKGASFPQLIGADADTLARIQNGVANFPVVLEHKRQKHTISLSVQATGTKEYVVQMEQLASLHKRVNNIVGNDAHFSFSDIIGRSDSMRDAVQMAKIAAQNDATVFLSGESGTGKELFAQAIHNSSARRGGPFIAVNCGALPKSLIEAELFGYESGSFTGAKREGCAGKFELANGGTIFLDEIGDMPFDVQVTLLRVLQNREVRRIGASKTIKIDVRVITATNQNLERLVADKMFREDLFYRINVFHIRIPPLRERKGDVQVLSEFFLQKYSGSMPGCKAKGFSPETMTLLSQYNWPGNVRQLENTVERAVYLTTTDQILPESLSPELQVHAVEAAEPEEEKPPRAASLSMRKGEKEKIEQALQQTHGNVKAAAQLLEISRRTLYRKLESYGIDCDKLRK